MEKQSIVDIDIMDHEALIERIKRLDLPTFEVMSPEVLARLTDRFDESLVRNVLYITTTNYEQRKLIKIIKNAYKLWKKDTDIIWGSMPQFESYPEYMENLQMDIECGFVITENGTFEENPGRARLKISFESINAVPLKAIHKGIQSVLSKDNENNEENDEEEFEDNYEKETDDNDQEDYDDDDEEVILEIFDKRIDKDKVIEEIENLKSAKVMHNRRWYVIYRVLRFLQWIGRSQTSFISWVKQHFGWEGEEEFRGVQSEFIHSEPNKWNKLIITNKNGKKNKTIGPDYYDFAVTIRDAFVEVEESGEMHDKDVFLINPQQGGINHNNKWK